MTQKSYIIATLALIIVLATPHGAEAWCWWHCSKTVTKKVVAVATTPATTPVTHTPAPPPPAGTEQAIQAWTTGYTYYDNDPPGSAIISNPMIHKVASGVGTYADPITLAVGYTSKGPDIAPGTRYYIPNVRRYFIVEDTCAACHAGHQGALWIDMWIDGSKVSQSAADQCANALTRVNAIILNPKSTYPVIAGPLSAAACALQYGDKLPL